MKRVGAGAHLPTLVEIIVSLRNAQTVEPTILPGLQWETEINVETSNGGHVIERPSRSPRRSHKKRNTRKDLESVLTGFRCILSHKDYHSHDRQ